VIFVRSLGEFQKPDSPAEKQAKKMQTHGGSAPAIPEPQHADRVFCPPCGTSHRPGVACPSMAAKAVVYVRNEGGRGNPFRDEDGKFAPGPRTKSDHRAVVIAMRDHIRELEQKPDDEDEPRKHPSARGGLITRAQLREAAERAEKALGGAKPPKPQNAVKTPRSAGGGATKPAATPKPTHPGIMVPHTPAVSIVVPHAALASAKPAASASPSAPPKPRLPFAATNAREEMPTHPGVVAGKKPPVSVVVPRSSIRPAEPKAPPAPASPFAATSAASEAADAKTHAAAQKTAFQRPRIDRNEHAADLQAETPARVSPAGFADTRGRGDGPAMPFVRTSQGSEQKTAAKDARATAEVGTPKARATNDPYAQPQAFGAGKPATKEGRAKMYEQQQSLHSPFAPTSAAEEAKAAEPKQQFAPGTAFGAGRMQAPRAGASFDEIARDHAVAAPADAQAHNQTQVDAALHALNDPTAGNKPPTERAAELGYTPGSKDDPLRGSASAPAPGAGGGMVGGGGGGSAGVGGAPAGSGGSGGGAQSPSAASGLRTSSAGEPPEYLKNSRANAAAAEASAKQAEKNVPDVQPSRAGLKFMGGFALGTLAGRAAGRAGGWFDTGVPIGMQVAQQANPYHLLTGR
jgi:hypothetical protein